MIVLFVLPGVAVTFTGFVGMEIEGVAEASVDAKPSTVPIFAEIL